MDRALNSLQFLTEADSFVYRVAGPTEAPVLIYLPGVHGDWTSFSEACTALAGTFRVVEVAYPRRGDWDLDDFASALGRLFERLTLGSAHLLAESFGSLPAWRFGLRSPASIRSLILAGGFTRPPYARLAGCAALARRLTPTALFELGVDAYVALPRGGWRRPDPEEGVPPFPAVRTKEGRRALCRRLSIIQKSDFTGSLGEISFPVRYLGGAHDRIVPVRREIRSLRSLLPAQGRFESHLISDAGHIVLVTHPKACADRIGRWVEEYERGRADS